MALGEIFARRLKILRRRHGWSQRALAERAGISRTHLARIETRVMEPTLGIIEKLAKALRVRPGALLE